MKIYFFLPKIIIAQKNTILATAGVITIFSFLRLYLKKISKKNDQTSLVCVCVYVCGHHHVCYFSCDWTEQVISLNLPFGIFLFQYFFFTYLFIYIFFSVPDNVLLIVICYILVKTKSVLFSFRFKMILMIEEYNFCRRHANNVNSMIHICIALLR